MTANDNVTKGGVSIEWVDRETLRYSENGFSILVWVDYEPGFFNQGRIIKASSIVRCDARPENIPELIDADQKQKIIYQIQQYYSSQKKRCRVEE